MSPLKAIRIVKHARKVAQSAERLLEATSDADREAAGRSLAEALVPAIETFIGRDVVEDEAVIRATTEVVQAAEALVLVYQGARVRRLVKNDTSIS